VGKPHGLAGEVYVVPISDDPRRFEAGSQLTREDGRRLVIESTRSHRTRFLVKFEGVESREAAEELRGPLFVPGTDLRALGDDEFWEHDVIGATVVDSAGIELGRVTALEAGPGQDRLVIETERGERYVPVVKEIVQAIDGAGHRITIDPPEGLLD
jgi:16S rRNA processing protein RimM